ncbi:DUF3558 domain-containing protein [Amycolatopsis jiangsuensis]|uniref:DUF3558 domain-containing protein n=1 Tax=Amycolatopsis jiangsuensis TaxID=1181879 RepID=A0A840J5Z8_9PSEU|nr:hypothetical protein [Amycolatopsis jiangsuensis]MBB4688837.1 hypothetical protein [Amycolatopsis jiangsuensis]
MVHDRRPGRLPKLFVLLIAAALAVSACGGPELGKENFARTTVPASAGGDPAGPITDPAAAPEVLRELQPCQFVGQDVLEQLGTPQDEPSPSGVRFDVCRGSVTDPGGKDISVEVTVGATVLSAADRTTGQVGGLPQVEAPAGAGSCTVSVLTSREPDLGISFDINYSGGDACPVGRTLATAAAKTLHNAPQKYAPSKGSLLAADPCAVLGQSAVDGVLTGAEPEATGLHSCQWGSTARVEVLLLPGRPPLEGSGWLKADVGTPSQAFRKQGTSGGSSCQVHWQHRPWQAGDVEIAQLEYSNSDAEAASDDPCGKAVTLSKQLAAKLPQP